MSRGVKILHVIQGTKKVRAATTDHNITKWSILFKIPHRFGMMYCVSFIILYSR